MYVTVGQKELHAPVFSHFDVLDHTGKRADHQTAETMYTYVSMLQSTIYLEKLKDRLVKSATNERKSDNTHWMDGDSGEMTRLKFQSEYGVDINELQRDQERIAALLEDLSIQKEYLTKLDHWYVADFQAFQHAWDAFWQVYQQRMSLLFTFREFLLGKNIVERTMTGTGLRQLYEEANALHQLFAESIAVNKPLITDIDDWITCQFQLGRMEPNNQHAPLVSDRWYRFVQSVFRLLWWGIFPVALILTATGVFSRGQLIWTGVLLLVWFLGYRIHQSKLKKMIRERRLARSKDQLGSQPIIKETYQQTFTQWKQAEEERLQTEKIYQFRAKLTALQNIAVGAGLLLFLFGILVRLTNVEAAMWCMGIAIGLIVLGIFLGKWCWMDVQIWADKLMLGKLKVSGRSVVYIDMKRRRNRFSVSTLGDPTRPLVWKIRKGDRAEARKHLEKWCDANYTSFIWRGRKKKE